MAHYQLDNQHPLPEQIRKIATGQVQKAINALKSLDKGREKSIHTVRKILKKLRSLLRFARYALSQETYEQEKEFYRNVGQQLGQVRDLASTMAIIDYMMEHYPDKTLHQPLKKMRKPVEKKHHKTLEHLLNDRECIDALIKELKAAKSRIPQWNFRDTSFAAFRQSLEKTYKDGRTTFRHAYSQSTAENFHEFRKRVKDLLYFLALIKPFWEEMLAPMEDRVEVLAEHLGNDHDLALLKEKVLHDQQQEPAEAWPVVGSIDAEQQRLQHIIYVLGRKIYAEKTKSFGQRCEVYRTCCKQEAKPA